MGRANLDLLESYGDRNNSGHDDSILDDNAISTGAPDDIACSGSLSGHRRSLRDPSADVALESLCPATGHRRYAELPGECGDPAPATGRANVRLDRNQLDDRRSTSSRLSGPVRRWCDAVLGAVVGAEMVVAGGKRRHSPEFTRDDVAEPGVSAASVDIPSAVDTHQIVASSALPSSEMWNPLQEDLAVDYRIDGRPIVSQRKLIRIERLCAFRVLGDQRALCIVIGIGIAFAVVVAPERFRPWHDALRCQQVPMRPKEREDLRIHHGCDVGVESAGAQRGDMIDEMRQTFALRPLLQVNRTVHEIDPVRIDALHELQHLGRIDIRIDADDVPFGEPLAELEKIRIVKRFATGEVQVPAHSGVVEKLGQLLGRSRRSDLRAQRSIGMEAIGAAEVACRHQAPVGLDVVTGGHMHLGFE